MPRKQNKKFSSLDEVLRTFLIEQDKEREKQIDNDWWWASELGLCKRKQFLRRLGIEPSENKEYRLMFLAEDGKAMHNWREQAAEKMGVLLEKEGTLQDEKLRYKGRFDLIVKLNGRPVLIDIKTQRPEAFFRRAREKPGRRVKDFQKMQLASYVLFARKRYPDLKEARIYYVDRGGGVREEYSFKFKKGRFKAVLKELEELNKYWELQEFPPAQKGWLCRFCSFKTVCEKIDQDGLSVDQVKQIYGSKR